MPYQCAVCGQCVAYDDEYRRDALTRSIVVCAKCYDTGHNCDKKRRIGSGSSRTSKSEWESRKIHELGVPLRTALKKRGLSALGGIVQSPGYRCVVKGSWHDRWSELFGSHDVLWRKCEGPCSGLTRLESSKEQGQGQESVAKKRNRGEVVESSVSASASNGVTSVAHAAKKKKKRR